MSTAPPTDASDAATDRGAPPPCAWRSWPLAERGWRRWAVATGLLAAALTIGFSTGRLDWAVAAFCLLAVAAWRYFIPVVYELGTLGVTRQVFSRQRRISWRSIGRFEVGSAGVFLSPHRERGPLDAFGGLYLPWCGHKDEVLANVTFYLTNSGR